jgi:urease accessory protein
MGARVFRDRALVYQNCAGMNSRSMMGPMKRAQAIRTAGHWDSASAVDQVVLDADERQRRRIVLTGQQGTVFLLDLPQATALRDGDGLVLDDGGIVRVVGRAEALVEITAADSHALARLAWHIGNRHIEVQIVGDRLRMRRDHVIEDMLRGLGARLLPLEAAFDPERGAYAHGHGAGHAHAHGHDHPHHQHDHHGAHSHDHDHG